MSRATRARSSHEFVDHTSEITLRLQAPSFPTLVREATLAFVDLVPNSIPRDEGDEWREFRVDGPDRAANLVDWLNELVYLCEVEEWIPVEVEATGEGDSSLRIRARGATLGEPFAGIKAATLHNAAVRERPDGVEGEVTFDV